MPRLMIKMTADYHRINLLWYSFLPSSKRENSKECKSIVDNRQADSEQMLKIGC